MWHDSYESDEAETKNGGKVVKGGLAHRVFQRVREGRTIAVEVPENRGSGGVCQGQQK